MRGYLRDTFPKSQRIAALTAFTYLLPHLIPHLNVPKKLGCFCSSSRFFPGVCADVHNCLPRVCSRHCLTRNGPGPRGTWGEGGGKMGHLNFNARSQLHVLEKSQKGTMCSPAQSMSVSRGHYSSRVKPPNAGPDQRDQREKATASQTV